MIKKELMSFEDDLNNVLKFKSLGFNCYIDDEYNKIYCCELNLDEYDMLNVLNMCEECINLNIHPLIIINNVYYNINDKNDLLKIDILVSDNPLLI